MLIFKLLALAIAFVIWVAVGVRNANRDFRPPIRAHIELFFAAVPMGFIGMFIVIPTWPDAIVYGGMAAILTGGLLSFSTPRQWRYYIEPKLKKRRIKQ